MQANIIVTAVALVAGLTALWSGQREASVQVVSRTASVSADPASAAAPSGANSKVSAANSLSPAAAVQPARTPPIKQPDLSLNASSSALTTRDKHSHADPQPADLPPNLREALENRRIPASTLVLKPVPGGYAMPAQGQHKTVVMAYIDENGKLRRIERVVEPIADAPVVVPAIAIPAPVIHATPSFPHKPRH